MINKLVTEIKSLGNFSDEEIELFFSHLTESFIAKGDHFLKIGEISHYIAYVTSGLTMYYNTHDGIDVPIDFTTEGEWLGHLKSFNNRIPADTAIKALEDTWLLRLSAAGMQELFQLHPKFMALKNYYTELSFFRNAEHGADLAMLNAKQRYYKFMQEKPDLINRVPQYYIAAYLGIKPQSLSRLRNEK